MSKEHIESLVEQITNEIIKESNLELIDVEYVKEHDWYLRVFLDKPNGVEVEDCQWVSEQLEDKLDELDPIKESYYLEVSSPGLDRPLKKDKDFTRHIGDEIEVHTFAPIDGRKLFVGTLMGFESNNINMNIAGQVVSLPKEQAAQVRLHLEF